MEEAERVSDRIAIIDQGKIVKEGTPNAIKRSTKSKTVEDAFLKLTGKTIRNEAGGAKDRMRAARKMWGG